MKTCSKCKRTLALEEFNHRSDKPHLWKSHCKGCIRSKNKNYYQSNSEKLISYSRKYRQAHREEINRKAKIRRDNQTRDEREAFSRYLRLWRELNYDKVKTYRQAQRAKRESAFVERVPFATIWNRDKGVCQLCGKDIDPKAKYPNWDCATLDHMPYL